MPGTSGASSRLARTCGRARVWRTRSGTRASTRPRSTTLRPCWSSIRATIPVRSGAVAAPGWRG
jgi:hypothetical protein